MAPRAPKRRAAAADDSDDGHDGHDDRVMNDPQTVVSDDDHRKLVGEYKPGSIVRIKLQNFLTYSHVDFAPGPRLNIVMGANGTGKSTLLNALCLGLGGEPKVLGRADDARAFIMYNQDQAEIEITVAPFPHHQKNLPTVFRRVIDAHKGSERGRGRGASTFFLDGQQVSAPDVKAAAQAYHITIDNLCTFLPQDKVGNFSGFDAKQLLIETEKTLTANQQLYTTHQKLIEAEEALQSGIKDVETLAGKANKLRAELEPLERAKEKHQERQEALAQAALLRLKLLQREFDVRCEAFQAIKEERDQKKKEMESAYKQTEPLKKKVAEAVTAEKKMTAKLKEFESAAKQAKDLMAKHTAKFSSHDDKMEELMCHISEIATTRMKQERELETAKLTLARLESKKYSEDAVQELSDRYNVARKEKSKAHGQLQDAIKEALQQHSAMKDIKEEIKRYQQRVSTLEDKATQRKNKIVKQFPDLGKIMTWLDNNRDKFRRDVWGPIACEVVPESNEIAAVLEQHTPNPVLKAFVCETKEDQALLFREIRELQKIPINVLLVPNGRVDAVERMYTDGKMKVLRREHDVKCYLDECFQAPDAVLQALRNQARVHRVLIGGPKTQASIERKGLLDVMCAPDPARNESKPHNSCVACPSGPKWVKYSQVVSRYNSAVSSRVDDVSASRLMGQGGEDGALVAARHDLERASADFDKLRPAIESAEKKKSDAECVLQEKEGVLTALKKDKDKYDTFKVKLASARRAVASAEEALQGDDVQEKKETSKELMNRISSAIDALEKQAEQQQHMLTAVVKAAGANFNKQWLTIAATRLNNDLLQKASEYEELKISAEKLQAAYHTAKNECLQLQTQINQAIPKEDTALHAKLDAVPIVDIPELKVTIETLETKANAIADNADAVKRYDELKAEVADVESRLKDLTDCKDDKLDGIKLLRAPWEEGLLNTVAKINAHFSDYMAQMGCTGEVRLGKGDEIDPASTGNFKEWGIQILVSFRDGTKAQVLSSKVQSGGERSVSTIMYLMALQNMMIAPFRCVDEINQGLDERNERLVFRRIVKNSTKAPKPGKLNDHQGQYFLITPKLLPGLYDMETDAATILFVWNGPHNFASPTDFSVDRLLAAARATKRARLTAPCGDDVAKEASDAENAVNGTGRASLGSSHSNKTRRLSVQS